MSARFVKKKKKKPQSYEIWLIQETWCLILIESSESFLAENWMAQKGERVTVLYSWLIHFDCWLIKVFRQADKRLKGHLIPPL